jgi:hypothetical protein
MDYTYSRHGAVVREVHADYRRSHVWYPLKQHLKFAYEALMFFSLIAGYVCLVAVVVGNFTN